MNRRQIPSRSVGGLVLGLAALGFAAPAPAQYAPAYRPAVPYYQPAAPRFYRPAAPAYRAQRRGSALPYNRSPYTDDWSTGRHLPFPKPWMLPTRDPADRGR